MSSLPEKKTSERMLWIFIYSREEIIVPSTAFTIVPFYASSQADAERQTHAWSERQPFPVVFVSLEPYPYGFQILYHGCPGKLPPKDV